MILVKKNVAISTIVLLVLSGTGSLLLNSWIALPLGITFSILLPGALLNLILKKHIYCNWESLLYIVGLGLSLLIFTALFQNEILHFLGVKRPLVQSFFFISVTIVSLINLGFGYRRWDYDAIKLPSFSFNRFDSIAIAASLILLLGFIGGAIRLNNGANNLLSTICYFGVVFLVIYLFYLHKKISTSTIITALWLTSLGILYSGWLRSGYVAGPDLDKEYQIFLLTKRSGYWSIGLYKNAYNACLSINLLPTALSIFTKLPNLLIFKLLMPAIYSLIVPVVFLIAKVRLKKRNAMLATFFFFSQPPFVTWWWIPVRQEIALLFFGLIVLLLVRSNRGIHTRITFLILGASMIVSHYSTSYIAIALFIIYRIAQALIFNKRKFIGSNLIPIMKYSYILILFLFTFLWYSQATVGFNGATQFITKSFENIGSLLSPNVQQQGQGPLDQLNVFSGAGSAPITPIDYAFTQQAAAQKQYNTAQLYLNSYGFKPPSYDQSESLTAQKLDLFRSVLKVLGNLLVAVGILILIVKTWLKKHLYPLVLFQVTGLIFLASVMFLPFFSISYGEDRLYQQLLIFISAGVVAFLSLEINSKFLSIARTILLLFVVIYFLLLNQIAQQLTNSSQLTMSLNNSGDQYYEYYITRQDTEAAQWLSKNYNSKIPIYGDNYSQYRLVSDGGLALLNNFHSGIFPNSLPLTSFVYQSSANTKTGTAFDSDEGLITYKFPTDFLTQKKNIIYNNNSDLIYR